MILLLLLLFFVFHFVFISVVVVVVAEVNLFPCVWVCATSFVAFDCIVNLLVSCYVWCLVHSAFDIVLFRSQYNHCIHIHDAEYTTHLLLFHFHISMCIVTFVFVLFWFDTIFFVVVSLFLDFIVASQCVSSSSPYAHTLCSYMCMSVGVFST